MTFDVASTDRALRRKIALTRLGMTAERAVRAFWPLWTVTALTLAAALFNLHATAPIEAFWIGALAFLVAFITALVHGARRFRSPTWAEAAARLDATLPGRPLGTLADAPSMSPSDPATSAIWAAHQRRMAARLKGARAVPGDLRASARDPFALRYVAMLALALGLLFGPALRLGAAPDLPPLALGPSDGPPPGPAWEGWIAPPAHTGLPVLYLADQDAQVLRVPEGSEITLRLYGEGLTLDETIDADGPEGGEGAFALTADGPGLLAIRGPGGREWGVEPLPDAPPEVASAGPMERTPEGETQLPFALRDDYAVTAGTARIALDLPAVDRIFHLAPEPEPREAFVLDLPLPISGDRGAFEEILVADLARHPFAGLPVVVTLRAEDGAGQLSAPFSIEGSLPQRRFFDPLARAVIEQRQALLWNREVNAADARLLLRAVSHRPQDAFSNEVTYLRLRTVIRRLEAFLAAGPLTAERRDEVTDALWDVAVEIEEGRLSDALARMQAAQERLADAIENGATEEEIAELMQELREATREYMRQLAQQGMDPGEQDFAEQGGEGQRVTGSEIQEMMDRIQELMEEGRTEEAMQLLQEFQEMMENLRITEGEGGEGDPLMGDLGDTLREQQELSDEAFRSLQERQEGQDQQGQQPSPEGQPGQQRGQPQAGQGQSGQQQPGSREGDGSDTERQGAEGGGEREGQGTSSRDLAERQGRLRRDLEDRRGQLPGDGSEADERASRALDRAEGAMDEAERALRQGDVPRALDRQADAIEGLRESMRALREQFERDDETRQADRGGDGEDTISGQGADPLGRMAGTDGRLGGDGDVPGAEAESRANELLEELRRRAADRNRPADERDYYERLLNRF
ncbi:uncharacterized protein (TIGR02302 family) [Hasllibacter halocynthiae]|uniref:Uncharacterized protein (TIGR02302 family) n=1 Tax=Hasllibacter halocynthiae TaxID=595589 RepID=A0A2T0X3X9_9RHOB|nr:DUF4175 family protein [Hasllibacter halocynthiae]PRY93640.1 uncharacterized protein (TIGR02302 family) [Hasllibacter halocynthiae]